MGAEGWIIDPESGARHSVAVSMQGQSFIVDRDDGRRQGFSPAALFPIEMREGAEIYGLTGSDRFRLGLTHVRDPLIEARLPPFSIPGRGGLWRFRALLLIAATMGAAGGALLID